VGRRFGQHFLARPSILQAIAEAACEPDAPLVLEIGPGRGALTEPLLARAQRVVAIEVDPVLVQYLRQKFSVAIEEGRFLLIEGDVLKADLSAWGPAPVVGNLPYYITSPILERTFAARTVTQAVFMMQAEVATRLCAAPGSRDYGFLSVVAQAQSVPEYLFEVPAAAFRPPPKVESAVVRLLPRDACIADIPAFLRFAGVCFRQKRKTLRNNLSAAFPKEIVDALPEAKLRAEQLSVSELARLFLFVHSEVTRKSCTAE
jgi:16S rRNA (adenine1518-N6/adenine1519-N6)-dimethyltransferase